MLTTLIHNSDYGVFEINPNVMKQFMKAAEAMDVMAMPTLDPIELRNFKYGAIRALKNPFSKFNFEKDKGIYDAMAQFLIAKI